MSKFLAPIHTWLFNKIKLNENLEKDIIEKFSENPNKNITDIVDFIHHNFETYLDDSPIEDIIDLSNIHGWLQNRIKITETRQAYLITNIIKKFGDESLEEIKECYISKGKAWGKNASEKYNVSTAFDLFNTLNNYILEGMPCDNANSIVTKEDTILEWRTVVDLHRDYWESVNGDAQIFYELRKAWLSSFVESANPKFKYIFEVKFLNEVKLYLNTIVLK